MKYGTYTLLVLVLLIGLFSISSQRQVLALSPDYATPKVRAQNADASPVGGFSAGETNSRIDDYINQDEQININPDSGVVKVLRVNEKILINDYVEAIIPCKKVNPRELRGPIRNLTRKEGGDADVIQDKVKGENFLHVTCPRFQLPYLEAAIAALDEEWVKEREDGSAELYYEGKFRDMRDVLGITQFYRGPEGFFWVDVLNNALYFNDQPAVMGLQQFGLKEVDIPPNQVSLDVSIYEVDVTNEYKLGLDFVAWKNGPGRNLFTGISQYAHLHGKYYVDYPAQCIDGTIIGICDNTVKLHDIIKDPTSRFRYGAFNFFATAAYVDFLANRGKAKLLTRSNVLVKSGNVGEVQSVDEIAAFRPATLPRPATAGTTEAPAADVSAPDVPAASGEMATDATCPCIQPVVPYPTGIPRSLDYGWNRVLDYVKAGTIGIRVTLTPYVGLETAETYLDIAVSDISGYSPQGTPMINTRYINSYIRLMDQRPYVVGGITRKEVVKSTAKIPLLGDLPVLGWLAGGEQDVARETEIVIVIHPRFQLGTESVLAKPIEAVTAMAQVDGSEKLKIPKNYFGFDQWLLDKEK